MGYTSPPPPSFRPACIVWLRYSHKETLIPAIKRSRLQKRKFRLEPASATPPIEPTQRPRRALTPAPGVTSLSAFINLSKRKTHSESHLSGGAGGLSESCSRIGTCFFLRRTPLEKIAPRHQKHTAAESEALPACALLFALSERPRWSDGRTRARRGAHSRARIFLLPRSISPLRYVVVSLT
jgi:hypothetical protein